MERKSERLARLEDCELDWINSLSESSRSYYAPYWLEFKDWLKTQNIEGYTGKGTEILALRDSDFDFRRTDRRRWRFEDLAVKYYKSLYEGKDFPSGTDNTKLTIVRSFFSFCKMKLEIRRGQIEESVPKRKYYRYSLRDLDAAKRYGDIRERWIFVGGKSLGQRIGDFRKLRVDQIEPLLDEFPPVPIDIPTRKKNVVAHPCLDRDALEAARDLIRSRNSDDSNPYMLPGYGEGPMTEQAINAAIKRVAKTAHKADPSVFKRAGNERLRFHNFRVFLNSALQNAGVDPDLREWIVGHKLSGTKKAYTTHQRAEAYNHAEAFLLIPRHEYIEERLTEVEDKLQRVLGPDVKLTKERVEELKQAGLKISYKGAELRKTPEGEAPEEFNASAKKKERKVVGEEELDNALNHGYDFISVLPSGRILIERVLD